MDSHKIKNWQRIVFDKTPLYIQPEKPDWFVPNRAADKALQALPSAENSHRGLGQLLKRINNNAAADYQSRSDGLKLDKLKECWIHITNKCNMRCGHCMFRSSPGAGSELSLQDCTKIINETYTLGCRIYFFTGGEPLVAEAFFQSVEEIFQHPDTHVVLLTNLSLISRVKERFASLPADRLHFQVSMDGLEEAHDTLRGRNAFHQLTQDLELLRELGFPITLSTTVTRRNVNEMKGIVDFAHKRQIANIHFLWLFKKGNADDTLFVAPEEIFPNLVAAQERAEEVGIRIDNIERLRSQAFSCPGTRYDLSNAGWQSLAVAPDGVIYPTPALIYSKGMACGHIRDGLEAVWKNSSVLDAIRNATLNDSEVYRNNPLRYIIGGGDMDHSYIHSEQITGGDPYIELYNSIITWLIVREANQYASDGFPAIKLKMGEKLGECPAEGESLFFTHSNCVLTLPGHDVRTQVEHFYSEAAQELKEDILNPICYDEALVQHIPEEMRFRSYGCGSPVIEADIQKGEFVVDLGSGTGIECFIAARLTGPAGRVAGIDMGDTMLGIANKTRKLVADNLGYDNMEFRKAFLERLPLEAASVDVVISNCVVNLSPDKRRVFNEIFRVLKPGGRFIISDISYNEEIPLEIKYNESLRGECIGGALSYTDLFGLLNDTGFSHSRILKGYHYRTVKDFDFYSITYEALKPPANQVPRLYDFPDFQQVIDQVETTPSCACFSAPLQPPANKITPLPQDTHKSGCMVCGEDLSYLESNRDIACHYCGEVKSANARCANGHYVCDQCHSTNAVDIIRQICKHSEEKDAVALVQAIRSHPHFPTHGPEHHSLVPAVILTVLKNNGESITQEQISTAFQRGASIAGGSCAFLGVCGAAIGVGIAFSILYQADPLKGEARQIVQQITQQVLGDIASYNAPRCCQRDVWLALQAASKIYRERMGKKLPVSHPIVCQQISKNKECIRDRCPLWPARK